MQKVRGSKLEMQCLHGKEKMGGEGAEAGLPAAKRANSDKAITMTTEAIVHELGGRGLGTRGARADLVARLNQDRKKDGMGLEEEGGCPWEGQVGELEAHLEKCPWMRVRCPNEGCTESPFRKDLPQHNKACGECRHCGMQRSGSLAEHEGCCWAANIDCPNEGCGVQHARGSMDSHRATCEREEVPCPCPGCDERLPREDVDAHLRALHQPSLESQKRDWSRIAALEERLRLNGAASP